MKLQLSKEQTKETKKKDRQENLERIYEKEAMDNKLIAKQVASMNNTTIVKVEEILNITQDYLTKNINERKDCIMIPFFGKFIYKPTLLKIRKEKKKELLAKINKQDI